MTGYPKPYFSKKVAFMKELYALSFRGRMMYFSGQVPEELYDQIEQMANTVDKALSFDDFCKVFSKRVLSELNIELIKFPVAHIFRVR